MRRPTTPTSKYGSKMRIKNEKMFNGLSTKEKVMLSKLLGNALIKKTSSKRTGTPSTSGVRRS